MSEANKQSKSWSRLDDLGTAASADVTTSPTDTTAGRLTKVGDFGNGAVLSITGDLDTLITNGKYYAVSATNRPIAENGYLSVYQSTTSSFNYQRYTGNATGRTFERIELSGVWQPWSEIYTTANLIDAQNLSGGTVSPNGTVSGASLNPAQTGTFRNVSGNNILNNGFGLWRKV